MYIHQHPNEHKHIIPDSVPGFPFHTLVSRLSSLVCTFLLAACSDFIHPVNSTPEPTEYSFNYWLLQSLYLYEDELPDLPKDGDSVQLLYNPLTDPYTYYTPPGKESEDKSTKTNTSKIIGGDVGMRYYNITGIEYPIYIARVYPKSPAGRAGIPRYGNILSVNGIELKGEHAKATYDSTLTFNKNIDLLIAYKGDTTLYKLQKEEVFAPTIFVDTLFENASKGYPGIVFIRIEGFKPETADPDSGTYGELKDYLISTKKDKRVRVLDLRNNPGGHVFQSTRMADLFVSKGTLSTKKMRSLTADGGSVNSISTTVAKAGDIGESGKYIILANRASASASEIFIAAVTELTDIPMVGTRTFGKGIGQSQIWTYERGLATITSLEFKTPKGTSYHGKGISPKYECERGIVNDTCAALVANKIYGVKIPKQEKSALAKHFTETTDDIKEFEGGAIEWADSDIYFKTFEKTYP